jgi:hypothetical protein
MMFKDVLIEFGADREMIEWTGDKTLYEFWQECERGDWMVWLYIALFPNSVADVFVTMTNQFNKKGYYDPDLCRKYLTKTICIGLEI